MKRRKILGFTALLLAVGLALSSCAELVDFVDGFVWGWGTVRGIDYDFRQNNRHNQEITDF